MSSYYTGLACLVLFDARGSVDSDGYRFCIPIMAFTAILLLALKFIPAVLHRPQQLVDALCNDLLCIIAHASCIDMLSSQSLRHGCALQSICFIMQQRFMGRMPSFATGTVVHTALVLILLFSYIQGPRISDLQSFMLSAVCPHVLEILAFTLARVHSVIVMAATATDV